MSFIYISNCRRCPLAQNLTSSVLNIFKILHDMSFCPNPINCFFVKSGHVPCT
ncbi:hypothetical protein HanHA300_Chr14g0512011 [Helianthus annuus]|nr:hypothetical protein HanHA300_Chr14g0512011 [Helianthus annuus]KAJ0467010.1 hypothetical protein HanIR_Chr14g0678491 [Helianthus annuus]KAJ0484522.1 hypothetical protein HanHA89_Chr14g0545061 [Helianthus annuus]KAJ0655076.1 hypothetical protein HanLR1_Chr14g0514341 [Helianthus annuus]